MQGRRLSCANACALMTVPVRIKPLKQHYKVLKPLFLISLPGLAERTVAHEHLPVSAKFCTDN